MGKKNNEIGKIVSKEAGEAAIKIVEVVALGVVSIIAKVITDSQKK